MAKEKATSPPHQIPIYAPAGFYLLRAPSLPTHIFSDITTTEVVNQKSESGDEELALTKMRQHTYATLKALVSDPVIEQALLVASPDIFEGIARICRTDEVTRQTAHAYSGILRYLIRMSTRPTPFGLFSGVAVGTLGDQTTAQLGSPVIQQMRTRVDMSWLLSIIQKVEEDKSLLAHLHVMVNRTVYIAGARAIIPYADVYGKGDKRSIALRATSVVQFVMERAKEAIPYKKLRREVSEAFPQASEKQIDGLLEQLWEHHFLISNLRPPLTSATPATYLLERLHTIEGATSFAAKLEKVITATATIDLAGVGASTRHIHALVETQEQLVSGKESNKQLYQVDAALNLESSQLNTAVGESVAEATETLLRLSRFVRGAQHLREYHAAFVEHYGIEAEVSVVDLLSAEFGLDAPPGYTEPSRTYPLPPLPLSNIEARDSVLCSLLAEALNQHATEIELTEAIIQRLTQWTPTDDNPPPLSIEMFLQIQAASCEAIDRGEWRGVVAPAAFSYGGRTFCRFFDILGSDALSKLQEYVRQEEMHSPDVIFAELSYLPTMGRQANVAIRPALRAYEIVINTPPSVPAEQVIVLSDLVVGVRNGRFYLRSLRLGKEVSVVQSHVLSMMHAPNICRFLLDVSMDRYLRLSSFDWGSVRNSPFLPRVVQKRMVLCPAQWNLQQEMIEPSGTGFEETRSFAGFQKWRERWRVPRYVYLTEADNRLLLDLEHPLLIAELLAELKKVGKNGYLRLQEMLPDFDHLWLRDSRNQAYIAEMVVPLLLKESPTGPFSPAEMTEVQRKKAMQPQYPQEMITSVQRRKLPGDEWTYLKLYASSKQHDEIIAGPLREIVQQLEEKKLIDRWFYIRYADPEPHVRVRFHAADLHAHDPTLIHALAWSRALVQRGLISRICVDSYDQEIERYGGPEAVDVLEGVFTVNSNSISAIIAAQYRREITLDPLAIAVFSVDQFFAFWGLDTAERLQYLQALTDKYSASEAFRPQRRLFCELLSPWEPDYDVTLRKQGELLRLLGSSQEHVIKKAAASIHELAAKGALWQTEENILGSLAHMHINRLLEFKRGQEPKIYAFWRHTLESLQRRPASKELRGQ